MSTRQYCALHLLLLLLLFMGCDDSKSDDQPIIKQTPKTDYFNKAVNLYSRGDYEKAIKYFDLAARDSNNPAIYCNRANCYSSLKKYEAAMKDYETAIKFAIAFDNNPNDPKLAYLYYNRGYAYLRWGKYSQAILDYEKTISLNVNYPDVNNELAWTLATCPDEKLRNPQRAVNLAKKECEKTMWKSAGVLDTLAAAYASANDYPNAISTQNKAIAQGADSEILSQLKERLHLYQNGKPYIDIIKNDMELPSQQSEITTSNPAGFKIVTFSNGKVEFCVPQAYVHSTGPDDTIAIRPSKNAGITLRFNLHYLEGKNVPQDGGVQFVKAQARKKGLKTMQISDKVLFTEGGIREESDHKYDMTFWQIGFQNAVVVMSGEIDQSKMNNQVVIDCMNAIPEIMKTFRKR